jgi:hypothetical protein
MEDDDYELTPWRFAKSGWKYVKRSKLHTN